MQLAVSSGQGLLAPTNPPLWHIHKSLSAWSQMPSIFLYLQPEHSPWHNIPFSFCKAVLWENVWFWFSQNSTHHLLTWAHAIGTGCMPAHILCAHHGWLKQEAMPVGRLLAPRRRSYRDVPAVDTCLCSWGKSVRRKVLCRAPDYSSPTLYSKYLVQYFISRTTCVFSFC